MNEPQAPTIWRRDDGTLALEWHDDERAPWYHVAPEVIAGWVATHNGLIADVARLRAALDEWHYDDCATATDPDAACTCRTDPLCDGCNGTGIAVGERIGPTGDIQQYEGACPNCFAPPRVVPEGTT